jgi:hypothetical protein
MAEQRKMAEIAEIQKIFQKHQQCSLKQNEKELEAQTIEKQLNSNFNTATDLDIVKRFLEKKFGFDLKAERAEVAGEAEKLKQEIRRLKSEAEQFKKCLEMHYPSGQMPGGPKDQAEKNRAICDKCKFKPFYVEQVQQEAEVAKRLQEREKKRQLDAQAKAAKNRKA